MAPHHSNVLYGVFHGAFLSITGIHLAHRFCTFSFLIDLTVTFANTQHNSIRSKAGNQRRVFHFRHTMKMIFTACFSFLTELLVDSDHKVPIRNIFSQLQSSRSRRPSQGISSFYYIIQCHGKIASEKKSVCVCVCVYFVCVPIFLYIVYCKEDRLSLQQQS